MKAEDKPASLASTEGLGRVPERTTGECLMALAVVRELTGTQQADLDATLKAVRERFKWIPVGDHLPEKCTEVMVAFAGQMSLASTGQYTGSAKDKNGWCYPSENNGACDDGSDPRVTHWMPLPEVPMMNIAWGPNV